MPRAQSFIISSSALNLQIRSIKFIQLNSVLLFSA